MILVFSATHAVLTEAPTPQVWAVVVTTPKMVLTVKQMWGWQQAQIDFNLEAWAQEFTWYKQLQ